MCCHGEKLLFGKSIAAIETAIPDDVRPVGFGQVGSYAISIDWSDGHDTGIYTFRYLRELCQCAGCASSRR